MDGWIRFWTWVLYGGAAVFSVLSVWVIVAGFSDIRKMFAELRRQRSEGEDSGAGGS